MDNKHGRYEWGRRPLSPEERKTLKAKMAAIQAYAEVKLDFQNPEDIWPGLPEKPMSKKRLQVAVGEMHILREAMIAHGAAEDEISDLTVFFWVLIESAHKQINYEQAAKDLDIERLVYKYGKYARRN